MTVTDTEQIQKLVTTYFKPQQLPLFVSWIKMCILIYQKAATADLKNDIGPTLKQDWFNIITFDGVKGKAASL